MIVRNWMQHNPTLVDGDTLLAEAKRILTENNLQALPVIENGRPPSPTASSPTKHRTG